jgi:cobalt/nickel transport protein
MKEFLQNKFLLAGIFVSLGVAGILSYYASSDPDGLEKVAEDKGFLDTAKDSANAGTPLADYGVEGIENERLSVGLSGVIGVFVTLIVAALIFKMIATRGKQNR